MTRLRALTLAIAATVLAAGARAQTQVWVLDETPGPGVEFTELQLAIDGAAPSALSLLAPGF